MILAKFITIILGIATLTCLATWLASKKENWGFATIASIIGFAIMVIVTKIANTLF